MQSGLKVLVVDDHNSMRSMIRKMLHQMDLCDAIEDASDGEEAWTKILRASFDLVISDVGMPRLDGIGLLKRCRKEADLRDLPFLMISGQAYPEWVAMASEWGAYDYIVKPFSYTFLKERIESLLDRKNSPDEVLFREVERLSLDGHPEAAVDRIEDLEKSVVLKPRWLSLKGECLLKMGRPEEAAEVIEKAMEVSGGTLSIYKVYAAVQQELGNVQKAIEALERADDLSPLDLDRKLVLGGMMLKTGSEEEGMRVLNAALRLAPAEERELYRLKIGEIYMENKQYAAAENLYIRTVKANPAAIEAFNRLGIALRRQGKWREAEKYYNLALKSHPNNAPICFNLGVLYLNRQEKAQAAKLFHKVLEIDPDFKKAAELLKQAQEP